MRDVHPIAARGFDSAAEIYERARPSYPDAAVEFIVEHMGLRRARTVVDLAAGTGKFTRELTSRGIGCIAVEPVAGMREQFARVLPGVRIVEGTAERMPFEDGSVDAITVAQAFHWFANDDAMREMSRVLRPGGEVALVWNARDDRTDWVARITEIFQPYEGTGSVRVPRHREQGWRSPVERSPEFSPVADREFVHSQTLSPEGLVDRFASVSFISVLPEHEKQRAVEKVRALIETHPDLQGRETIDHPYLTEVYLLRRK